MLYSGFILQLVAFLPRTTIAIPYESATKVRQSSTYNDVLNIQRADAVKEAFIFAWTGYQKYAFPKDELHPVTNQSSNSRNGWGASAVDALSTALLMQIPDIVDTILEFVPTINFDETSTQISLFETTIRYMGGMLSGYDLLKGPLSKFGKNSTQVEALLQQTERLANNLAFAFDTPTGIPSNELYFNPSRTAGSTINGLATVGTLVLEWTRLSDLTGNPRYAQLAQNGESFLLDPKPATSEPFPGLVGMNIDITNGLFQDAFGGWVGGADSFYEYLIKMYVYDTGRFGDYRDRWVKAADSTISNLASRPSSRQDVTYLAEYNGKKLIYESQHLACFDGGNFILAGLTLNEDKYVQFGLELVNGCRNTYSNTLTKIGPEVFRWVEKNTVSNDSSNPQPPPSQAEFYQKAGFYATSAGYILRPEVIESFYYAYRATGDQIYRDWAWEAFVAINSTCRVGSGFAGIKDVNAPNGGGYQDFQESFFFAEVMKYSYLIHAPDDVWQVEYDDKNHYVFNTEAHPFKVFGPPI